MNNTAIIEIGEAKVKLAQFEKKQLINLFVLPTYKISDLDVSNKILELIRDKKIKVDALISSIPRHMVTTRYLKIPSIDPKEIQKMVELQVPRQLPYPPEQIVHAFNTNFSDKSGYSYVFLVLVHREIINRHLKILKDAGLASQAITLNSEGNPNLFQNSSLPGKDEEIILIDIDSNYADIEIISGRKLLFSRPVSLEAQSQDLTSTIDSWYTKLTQEINRSQETCRKEIIQVKINRIILTGSLKIVSGLKDKLGVEFNLPVSILEPFKEVGITSGLELKKYIDGDDSFSSIIGLGITAIEPSFNLLPNEYKAEKEKLIKRKALLKTASLLAAFIFIILAIITKDAFLKNHYIKKFDTDYKKLSSQTQNLEAMLNKLKIIKGHFANKVKTVDIIAELFKTVPQGIWLNMLTYEADHSVTLKGQAGDLSSVFKFVDVLEKSPYFENIQVKYTTKRKLGEREITDFELACPLSLKE